MATDPTDPSSVRVELDDSANRVGDADPFSEPGAGSRPGRSTGRARLFVIAVALGAVVLVVVLLRPESGTSAVGEPVGVPDAPAVTTTITTTTTGGRFQPDSTAESSSATTAVPVDGFERVPLDGFFLNGVVKVDEGWIALRFRQSGSELVRSTDGLVWGPLTGRPLPGEIIGFGLVSDEILVAISSPPAGVRSEVQIWSLDEQAEWQRAPEYGTVRGDGVFSAQFSDDAIVLLSGTQDAVLEPSPLVAGVLEGILEPDLAALTCTAARVPVDSDQGSGRTNDFVFSDCDGEVIATIPEDELTDTGALAIVGCLEELNESGIPGFTLDAIRLSPDEEPGTIPIGQASFPLSIEATADGVVMILVSPLEFLQSCSAVVEAGDLRPTLHRWSPAVGLEQIDTEVLVDRRVGVGPEFFLPGFSLTADDGSFILLTPSAAYETNDFDEFDLLVENPLPGGVLLPNLAHGAFVAQSPDQLVVFDEENGWRVIDIDPSFQEGFLLATDEYVVVMYRESPPVELVKIPFDTD